MADSCVPQPHPPPNLASSVKTLDDEASPTAPIRALVSQSLSISSPIRQIQNQSPSPPAKSTSQIQNPDVSSSSDKTLIATSPVYNYYEEEDENRESSHAQASSDDDNEAILPISTYYRPQSRYYANFDNRNEEDGFKIEPTKPLEFPWSFIKNLPTGVGAGLDNTGNTCFIASVLQCFTHTVPLIESLRSYNHQAPCYCGDENFCVMKALREHIELALRYSGKSLSLDLFRRNINHFSPDFQINNQEDAHEFLQSFLDKLESCCLDNRNNTASVSDPCEDVNIVDHVFGGRLMSRLHCCSCNSYSDTFEPSLGLSLEIEDVDDLWSALESFTRVEKLEDQLTCDNCKEKVSKEKQLKLDKLPLVATFHLKRFKNDGITMEKIFKEVTFPLQLDLLPYMSGNDNLEVSTKYHLYAMVEHLGNGVSFGHYTSYVRSGLETWHNFDDSRVRTISEDCVLSQNAYMLFYAREGTPWFSSVYEELKPLFEANPLSFSPKSVLETTTCMEEIVSDRTNKACNNSVEVSIPGRDYSDLRCSEPQEEVFHLSESCSDSDLASDAFEPHKVVDKPKKPIAETYHQEEPIMYSAQNRATLYSDDAFVPVVDIPKQDLSPKRKAEERDNIGDANQIKFKIQKQQKSTPKRQGKFEIQRDHLQINKKKEKKEETSGTKVFRNIVADPKDKEIAMSYLKRMPPNSRSRLLAEAMGVADSSIKKKKISY
ncbi:unnamed protein product [Cochlearia groenlandica]